jgi:YebC/PmpR family DNA-binding regulatory protein
VSGHSKWAKIKRGKASEDAKRGAAFTKLGNSIAIAAKNGGDPNFNPTLALAIDKAKQANMPNANIDRSIKRGTGELGGDAIVEYTYEGYGPGGIAIIVETASDNKNRISTDVKTAFSKNGGNMAETGAVAFQFTRKGVIRVEVTGDMDEAILTVLDAGAEDAFDSDGELIVYTDMKHLHSVSTKLEEAGLNVTEADLQFVPNDSMIISDEIIARKAMKLLDALEEIDDVTNTFTNFDIDDAVASKL